MTCTDFPESTCNKSIQTEQSPQAQSKLSSPPFNFQFPNPTGISPQFHLCTAFFPERNDVTKHIPESSVQKKSQTLRKTHSALDGSEQKECETAAASSTLSSHGTGYLSSMEASPPATGWSGWEFISRKKGEKEPKEKHLLGFQETPSAAAALQERGTKPFPVHGRWCCWGFLFAPKPKEGMGWGTRSSPKPRALLFWPLRSRQLPVLRAWSMQCTKGLRMQPGSREC